MGARDPNAVADVAQRLNDRLKAVAKNRGVEGRFLQQRFALERFLHRLMRSPFRDKIVVKGGMVMLTLTGDMLRPTEDIDANLAGFSEEAVREMVTVVAATDPESEDGLVFDLAELSVRPIMETGDSGLRALFWAVYPDGSKRPVRVRMKLDVGPGAPEMSHRMEALPPTVKGYGPVELPMYRWERVFGEKVHAIAKHGLFNTRAKDYYDLVMMARHGRFRGEDLVAGLVEVFTGRGKPALASDLAGLSDAYAEAQAKVWRDFCKPESGLRIAIPTLAEVLAEVRPFVLPPLGAAARGEAFAMEWLPGEGWKPAEPKSSPAP